MNATLEDNYADSSLGGVWAKRYGPSQIVYEDPTTRSKALGKARIMKILGVEGEWRGLPILRVHAWFEKTDTDKEVLILGMPKDEELEHLSKNWEFVDRRVRQLNNIRKHPSLQLNDPDTFIAGRSSELHDLKRLRDAVDFAIGAREKYEYPR